MSKYSRYICGGRNERLSIMHWSLRLMFTIIVLYTSPIESTNIITMLHPSLACYCMPYFPFHTLSEQMWFLERGISLNFWILQRTNRLFLALCLWQQLEIDDGQIGCGDKTPKWVHSNLVWLAIKGDEYEIHPLATLGSGPFIYYKTHNMRLNISLDYLTCINTWHPSIARLYTWTFPWY